MTDDTPGLARLLQLTGESDPAAFSALYDATAPRVYGLARTVFVDGDAAARATQSAFHRVWEQAPHFQFSFGPEHTDEQARNRTVATWVETLAHQTFLGLIPTGLYGDVAAAEEVTAATNELPELGSLTHGQRQSLCLAWAGGRHYRDLSAELGVGLPTLKSRLRDAVQRLNSTYRSKLSGESEASDQQTTDPMLARPVTPAVTARTGEAPSFTDEIDGDLANGLASELAPLVALDALDDDEKVLIESHVARAGHDQVDAWRQRVTLTERTITWAFRRLATEPPSSLLQQILDTLPEQNIGVGFMTDFNEADEFNDAGTPNEPKKLWARWIFVALGGLVLIALIWAVAGTVLGNNVVGTVDDADDLYSTEAVEMAEGGTVRGHVSDAEDLAYLSFEDLPAVGEDELYQVWLFTEPGGTASSLGSFTAQELLDNEATINNASDYVQAWISVEPASGSEKPTAEPAAEVPLTDRMTEGPMYGGQP